MNIKPKLKQNKDTGVWTASFLNEDGEKFELSGNDVGSVISLWYKKHKEILNIKPKGKT